MNNKGIIYFILLLLTGNSLFAQKANTEINYFEKGYNVYVENLDSAIYYYDLGVDYYQNKKDWEKHVYCLSGLAAAWNTKGYLTLSYENAQQAFATANKYLPKDGIAYSSTLNNLAYYELAKGNFIKAIEYYNQALIIEEKNKDTQAINLVLKNISRCYNQKGDFSESRRYIRRALNHGLKELPPKDITNAANYLALAQNYKNTGQSDTALILYQSVLDRIAQYPLKEKTFAAKLKSITYEDIAAIHFEFQNEALFTKSIDDAQICSKIAFQHESAHLYMLRGKWDLRNQNGKSAIKNFKKALSLAEYNLGKQPVIGSYHFNLAQSYLLNNSIPSSLHQFQIALSQYAKEFNSTDPTANPQIDDLFIDQELLKILQAKAETLLLAYDQNQDKTYLSAAKNTYQLAIDLLNKLRKSYLGQGSKELLTSFALPIFEGAIQVNYTLYEKDPSRARLAELLTIAENSKAILLLESINEIAALGMAGIPADLLDKEKSLILDIQYLERQLADSQTADKTANIEENLFLVQKEHRELIQLFEQDYQRYHQLKYDSKLASLSQIQQKIDGQSCVLEYFIGEQSIFIFNLTAQTASVRKVAKPINFNAQVEVLRSLLDTPPSTNEANGQFQQFTSAAHDLYNQLIAPAQLDSTLNRVIIIPDDILSYLPFEILLRDESENANVDYSIENLNYLIKDYQLAYNYSATLFCRESLAPQKNAKAFIGFAPSFGTTQTQALSTRNCNLDQLYALDCTADEVRKINGLFKGQALVGEAASKAKFINEIADYRIAHLATHSCLDDTNPMNNKIFLNDGYISNYDLYNLQLNTELAVLSACKTGTGVLQRGEGVISLARGFIHAGCPAVLMSLWSVEDCSTADIMTEYYRCLKAGLPKDRALSEAKINFLQSANKLNAHPFYWAPFVQFGDTAGMEFKTSKINWLWILATAVIGIFSIWYRRRKG